MEKKLKFMFIFWQICLVSYAQMVFIKGVPDYSQPPDSSIASTINRTNYCSPFAFLNIVEYWDSVRVHPNANGMMGGLPVKNTVEYIGWFMDTNNQGNVLRENGNTLPPAQGTYNFDQHLGMLEYALFDSVNNFGFPFPIPPMKKSYGWDISPPSLIDFFIYKDQIDQGRPVKLDFLYWNIVPTGDSIIDPGPPEDIIYIYKWDSVKSNTAFDPDAPFEEWNLEAIPSENNIGHAVTGVGYIMDSLDFAIVHDNWRNTPKNIAIPWSDINFAPQMVTGLIHVIVPPVIVKVYLPDTTAFPGQQIIIPIAVDNLTGLNVLSYQTAITFDQNILNATGATSNGSLSSLWGLPSVNTSTPGQIIVSGAGTPALADSGNLVLLQFDVVGSPGDTSQLLFQSFTFNTGDPAANITNGSLAVLPLIDITISSNPIGLSILVDGTGYPTPQTFKWNPGDAHQLNAPSPQSGGSGIRYIFDSWSNGGSQNQIIIVPAINTTYTATYNTEYELTTSINPQGSGSININPNQSWFLNGSQVTLEAIPQTNYTFSNWTGDLTGTINPDTLLMDGPKTVTAQFNMINDISDNESDAIPEKFELLQNYPNPFNSETKIAYSLPQEARVNLRIFNIVGKDVITLVDEIQSMGNKSIIWTGQDSNGTPAGSGIYIYQLEIIGKNINQRYSRKMLLLK